jgi:hypothetical protein
MFKVPFLFIIHGLSFDYIFLRDIDRWTLHINRWTLHINSDHYILTVEHYILKCSVEIKWTWRRVGLLKFDTEYKSKGVPRQAEVAQGVPGVG